MKDNLNPFKIVGILAVILLVSPLFTYSQKSNKIKILGAKNASIDTQKGTRTLVGNVRFKQGKTLMYCDSAVSYSKSNVMKAFGHVKVVDKEKKTTMTGDSLSFDGVKHLGQLRGNITLTNETQILKTKRLDFDTQTNSTTYTGGGIITNTENTSVLKSERGNYNTNTKVFFFKKEVSYVTEDYTILSDTMEYNTQTELVKFHGPTNIINDSNTIYCESGFYDQTHQFSAFSKNVKMVSKEQIMKADSVVYDEKLKYGEGFGHVEIYDTINKTEVYGDYAKYNTSKKTSLVTGHSRLLMAFTKDTLQLHSDSLYTQMDPTGIFRLVQAFHQVQFFKPDLQGKCDSLSFSELDSTIRMFYNPIVWVDSNQITGKEIVITNYDGVIQNMQIFEEAFIISEEDSALYNQIKGKSLFAHFRNNEIYKIDVNRSGQTIYYVRDEDQELMGMNRLDCSSMSIFIDSDGINNIKFYNQPDGVFLPMSKITEQLKLLRYFYWRANERPQSIKDIFNWTAVPDYIIKRRRSK
ncbi:MAG: lipopolysaccharide assembly outer membrane protein LptD (OstA) [Salibacteraceae bacterium]|jgi:lipopolysaccharide assembly outer membrane protein LptD (OstA)